MKLNVRQFCVYLHTIDGAPLYVGKGICSRPFETSRRNEKWVEAVERAGHFEVEILGWFDSSTEALKVELANIVSRKPLANLINNGYRRPEAARARVSALLKGRSVNEETRRRMGQARRGRIPWNKGVPMTKEQKRKLSLVARGKDEVKEVTTGTRYPSVKEACRVLDIPKTTMIQHLRGRLKHARGKVFEYV